MGGRSDDRRAKQPRPEPNLELPSLRLRRKKKQAESEGPAVESPVERPRSLESARRQAENLRVPPAPPTARMPHPPTPPAPPAAAAHTPPPPPQPAKSRPPAPPAPPRLEDEQTHPVPPVEEDRPKPKRVPKPPKAIKEPKPPREPKPAKKPKRERAATPLAWLPGYVSAIVTGALCGGLTVLLAWATAEGCAAARGVGTCGGYGVFALVAILGIDIVVGTALLRLFRVIDPATTAMLGVGLVAVLAMVFFLGDTQSFAMVYVIPTLMAATFAFAWWITKAIAQRVED